MMIPTRTKILAGVLAAATCTFAAQAQSSDALLKKLVEKKILTQEEADALKKEASADFEKAYRSKTGLPDWVNQLKISGDVRGRFDGIYTDNEVAGGPNADRNRLRYRLRVGATATFKDNFELGLRLTSGEAQGTFGGDAISGNSSLQDNGSKKFVWIDLAYGKWTPLNTDTWKLGGTIGKMENPFVVSPLVFDDDYTPEGVALAGSYSPNKDHTIRLAGGLFWLDEINQGAQASDDPFMFGSQARWDAKWTSALDSSIGAGIFAITDQITLTNFSVPNVNVGNTRNADGTLANEMIPVVLDAALTYSLDPFPTHRARFPIKVFGTYMYNLGSSENNEGYEVGLSLGKAGKKDTWELAYRWRYLDRDAWFEEVVDSDFGAFYQAGHPNSGAGSGYRAGTNVKGHIFKASYSPADAFTLSITYLMTELVDASVVAGRKTESDVGRLLVDASWKF